VLQVVIVKGVRLLFKDKKALTLLSVFIISIIVLYIVIIGNFVIAFFLVLRIYFSL
jgi:hypothetical protein